ncbi:hypothetical protein G5714_024615 [Onychostoma macrolepis]|uniref:Uncharacterized protein n=1 Tax=Onychostoma macrolepis TaxID=369639 RepID=A0A7J6BLU4_9TELE|nr:hypothetical protein G5714_024615 [Onychostoma macrolepis]
MTQRGGRQKRPRPSGAVSHRDLKGRGGSTLPRRRAKRPRSDDAMTQREEGRNGHAHPGRGQSQRPETPGTVAPSPPAR